MSIKVGKVGMIPRQSIIISDRTRQEMGDLNSVEENMKEIGLISPLAVKDNKDGTYRLLAGGRRFAILERNNVESIPCRIFERDLNEMEMKIIEKSENFYRKDMEFWEMDKLTLEIHQMQQELHGVKASGPGEGWGMKDTAELVGGVTSMTVSNAIKRAQAREAFPELFEKCKNASDASKVIKKMDEAVIKSVIADKIEKSKNDTDLKQIAKCYILRSVFEGMKEIPDNTYHLVEIDPPYAIDLNEAKKADGESLYTKTDYNEIPKSVYMDGHPDPKHPWRGMNELFRQCYRVMSTHSWLICWFAPEPWFDNIYKALINAGFNTTRMCGIWSKPTGQSKRPEIHLANTYEMFFYAWKGRPALNKPGRSNNFNFSPVFAQNKTHPTERPIELTDELYTTFAFPGSRVLIPFAGSGNGILSANKLGMSAIAFDLSKGYKDSFLVKLHGMKSP